MLDYKFDTISSNSINEAILFSCYKEENSSIQGFKLYYDPTDTSEIKPAYISFGSKSVTSPATYKVSANASLRNTIVLRHLAGEDILYIYVGNDNGLISTYNIDYFKHTLSWSNASSSA